MSCCVCVIAGYARSGVPRPQSRLSAENSHCTIMHTLKLHHHVLLCVGVIAGYARSGVPRPQDGISAENSHCTILHTLKLHHHVLLCVCHCRLRTIWFAQASERTQRGGKPAVLWALWGWRQKAGRERECWRGRERGKGGPRQAHTWEQQTKPEPCTICACVRRGRGRA